MRSWLEWRLLATAVTFMAALASARALPGRACHRLGRRFSRIRTSDIGETFKPEQVVRAVNTASRLVPGGSNCLIRALTAQALLARQGLRSELVFGVARGPAGALRSHAWLRCQGSVLLGETGVTGFAAMPNPVDRF